MCLSYYERESCYQFFFLTTVYMYMTCVTMQKGKGL